MSKKIKIFVTDDNSIFLDGLKYLLVRTPDIELIGTASNGESLLENPFYQQADIILLDIEMPVLNGFEVAKKINWINPRIKLIAITMYEDEIYLEKLVSSGFRGFVNKNDVNEKLMEVIRKVNKNDFVFPGNINIY